ncbi:hypothetical protein HPB47_025438 [Ixodes persulcatus]|uniref:Uncharacterized protein n=1 Tax=Ixodes persulcatus TaxID=34615 RepID=A0AC60Q3S6_IXOPE|nr:hypothetical protein HPB47_025438 [Ixodes persulcatus]
MVRPTLSLVTPSLATITDDISESKRCLVEGEDVLNCDHVIECCVAPEPTADSVRTVAYVVQSSPLHAYPVQKHVSSTAHYLGGGVSLPEEKFDWAIAGLSHYVKKGKTVVPDDKRIAKARCHLSNYLTEEVGLSHYVKKRKTTVADDDRIGKALCHLSNFLSEKNRPSKAEKCPQVPLAPPCALGVS